MTSPDPQHETAVGNERRAWLKYPLGIGEPIISVAIDGSGRYPAVVEHAALSSPNLNGSAQSRRFREGGAPPRMARLVRLWGEGRGRIAMGLFCSALTCVASSIANALLDAGAGGILSSAYLKRLAVGYSAAAVVVITVFPLLPALNRRMARLTSPKRGNRPGA